MKKADVRKVSVLVPEELYQRLQKNFEWGERSKIFLRVLEWVCEKVERHGKNALLVLLREEDFDSLVRMRGQYGDDTRPAAN